MSTPIDEVFLGIQGEGSRMGVPSVFVRTGGCNLQCEGFGCTVISPLDNETVITGCDSIHAVNKTHFKHTWVYYDDSIELIHRINEQFVNEVTHGNAEKPDIIFTGGEPLLHYRDQVMINVIEHFTSRGHKVFFETNATIPIDFKVYDIYKNVSFSMSVKMSASGEDIHKRWKPEVANEYLRNTKDSYFKFVLSKKSLKHETNEIFKYLEKIPFFGIVYCMPLGETSEEVDTNAKAVYEFALKAGLRYSDRIHIRIFNDLRGV